MQALIIIQAIVQIILIICNKIKIKVKITHPHKVKINNENILLFFLITINI